MCGPTDTVVVRVEERGAQAPSAADSVNKPAMAHNLSEADANGILSKSMDPPVPSLAARYTCASILVGVFAVWGKYTFVDEAKVPGGGRVELHNWKVPAALTTFYLVSLPLLRWFSNKFLLPNVDVKILLREAMILYNAGQVVLNAWMVYRFVDAVMFRGHPFVGGPVDLVDTGATFAIWVHYCDKYLEFLDTYFMVLRGKMDQVSFLHVYHHTSISWAWWFGLKLHPGGDGYFGALLNSWIHVMMYSYYTFSLLKVHCPWKRYLTQAQLLQFTTVLLYSFWSMNRMPPGSNWGHYAAHCIQDFEMISLFLLFLHFYRKAYSQKQKDAALKKQALLKALEPETDSSADAVAEQASISSISSDEDRDDRSS
jgi:elongation of very long chain fatty acids protein 4